MSALATRKRHRYDVQLQQSDGELVQDKVIVYWRTDWEGHEASAANARVAEINALLIRTGQVSPKNGEPLRVAPVAAVLDQDFEKAQGPE